MIIDLPYVMDRETVKALLQITTTEYDALIDIYLPIVSQDINLICNQDFVCEYTGTLTSGSNVITDIVLSVVSKDWLVSTKEYVNSKVTDADMDGYSLTVSDTAAATEEDSTILVNQFPIAKRIVAAQMIAFHVSKNVGINSATNGSIQSKSLPPLSVTYNGDDNSISSYGYPMYIVSSLQQIRKPRFY